MVCGITDKPKRTRIAALAVALFTVVAPMAACGADAQSSVWRDVAYGEETLQTLDVYAPKDAKKAPIILMVHGGAWAFGDKGNFAVVANKADHYLPKGYVFISVNYRMLPAADPVEQARDVARALSYVQTNANLWGGDPKRVVLMGHSAGAHLISLLNADPAFAKEVGAEPWLAAVSLDSGAYDVEAIMKRRHLPLFDRAFGKDKAFWRQASPIRRSGGKPAPMLLVCSSRGRDSCGQAEAFKAALAKEKAAASVAPEDLSHREINLNLGRANSYTKRVDAFLQAQGLP